METSTQPLTRLSWRSHPVLTASPTKTTLLVLVILLTGGGIFANTGSPGWGLFSILVLVFAVRDYWFPTDYVLSETGVEVRFWFYTRRKPWHALRSYYPERRGVLLSPFARPHRLENFRGMYLRFADNRDEVLQWLEQVFTTPQDGNP